MTCGVLIADAPSARSEAGRGGTSRNDSALNGEVSGQKRDELRLAVPKGCMEEAAMRESFCNGVGRRLPLAYFHVAHRAAGLSRARSLRGMPSYRLSNPFSVCPWWWHLVREQPGQHGKLESSFGN